MAGMACKINQTPLFAYHGLERVSICVVSHFLLGPPFGRGYRRRQPLLARLSRNDALWFWFAHKARREQCTYNILIPVDSHETRLLEYISGAARGAVAVDVFSFAAVWHLNIRPPFAACPYACALDITLAYVRLVVLCVHAWGWRGSEAAVAVAFHTPHFS